MEKSVHYHGRKPPSFSSSLLDAIYRSIDESDGGSLGPAVSSTSKPKIASTNQKRIPTSQPPANLRLHISTSSSSDCSSFNGFSSSDADSTARPRPIHTRRERHRSDLPPERKRPSSIASRIRDLRNLPSQASPRARVAAFLNAIFAGGRSRSLPKKPKFAAAEEKAARSCINKMPSASRGDKQRSVRFSQDAFPIATRDRRMVLEDLLRGLDLEEEDESDCESVSSSELFELDSLSTAIGRFRDELPVYETTHLRANRAIAHGFVV